MIHFLLRRFMLILFFYLIIGCFSERIAPYPYTKQDFSVTLQPPSGQHIFGTDQFGCNIFSRVIVGSRSIIEGSIYFSYSILVGAGLGFLGLGMQPPSPDRGLQVNDGRNYILTVWWITVFPSLAISSMVLGVNLLADSFIDGH